MAIDIDALVRKTKADWMDCFDYETTNPNNIVNYAERFIRAIVQQEIAATLALVKKEQDHDPGSR